MIELPNHLSEEQYFRKVLKKGDSPDSVGVAKSAVSNFKYFSSDVYDADSDELLRQLAKENNTDKVMIVMNSFIDWMGQDHPNILWKRLPTQKGSILKKKSSKSIKDYMSFIKKYIKLCYGIRVYEDDWRDFVAIPVKTEEEDQESEPLTKKEFKAILEEINDAKRKTMYLFMKDTGFRILETMRVRRSHFDFTRNPPRCNLPKSLVKGKTHKKTGRMTHESASRVKTLIKDMDDDAIVFASGQTSDRQSRNNEERYWNRRVKKAGFTEKYNNGRIKKNIHSVRKYCSTQLYNATKDEVYAHGYVGHSKYLKQYIILSEDQKDELFRRATPYLSVFEDVVVVEPDKEKLKKEITEQVTNALVERFGILDKEIRERKLIPGN